MDEPLAAEARTAIEALAAALLDASQWFVRKRGAFLPHGAVLERGGEIRLVMAASGDLDAPVTAEEELPVLHQALRTHGRDEQVVAVAVCEDVTITLQGQKPTRAIKVLVEHRGGTTVAVYEPWRRTLLRRIVFGNPSIVPADPEVTPWERGHPPNPPCS